MHICNKKTTPIGFILASDDDPRDQRASHAASSFSRSRAAPVGSSRGDSSEFVSMIAHLKEKSEGANSPDSPPAGNRSPQTPNAFVRTRKSARRGQSAYGLEIIPVRCEPEEPLALNARCGAFAAASSTSSHLVKVKLQQLPNPGLKLRHHSPTQHQRSELESILKQSSSVHFDLDPSEDDMKTHEKLHKTITSMKEGKTHQDRIDTNQDFEDLLATYSPFIKFSDQKKSKECRERSSKSFLPASGVPQTSLRYLF